MDDARSTPPRPLVSLGGGQSWQPYLPRSGLCAKMRSGGCSLFVATNIFMLFLALFSSAQIAASPVRVARRTAVQRDRQVAKGAGFPGAPRTQADGNGVSTGACPLAAPNHICRPGPGA
jgi:hypothetical protein